MSLLFGIIDRVIPPEHEDIPSLNQEITTSALISSEESRYRRLLRHLRRFQQRENTSSQELRGKLKRIVLYGTIAGVVVSLILGILFVGVLYVVIKDSQNGLVLSLLIQTLPYKPNTNSNNIIFRNSQALWVSIGAVFGFSGGYLIYKCSNLISFRAFAVTCTIIVFFVGAGLFGTSIADFETVTNSDQIYLWNLDCCDPETNGGWEIMSSTFGWTNKASLGQVIGYVLYWVVVLVRTFIILRKRNATDLTETNEANNN
ncbi:27739_t:CDS:2 [Dentiscutata erythropus]|uniref:27739_t:CDS:1 n=1 Tax=Dentiscutata erythropus TaxID=1348616 RepID=A0A9N9AXZ9_9GLOM|nr:27739_t:CDS:2 [Dentiscutata erythropus]